jgi:N-glycosylase/DNA lyase
MNLIKRVNDLKKNSELMKKIQQKLKEFENLGNQRFPKCQKHNVLQHNKNMFSELSFCTLTAGASASSGIKCQNVLHDKFHKLSKKNLQKELKRLGYRFHNRAEYIHKNQEKLNLLPKINKMDSISARNFLVKNFKGIGMKEASHFLRNIGRKDIAIIDRHILRSLGFKFKSLNPKKYLEIEQKLRNMAKKTKTNLAELDLLLWFGATGKLLK